VETLARKWRHRLTLLDPKRATATCAICGVTRVVWVSSGVGRRRWRCARAKREKDYSHGKWARTRHRGARRYRLAVSLVCSRCGFVAEDSCQIDRHHKDGDWRNDDPDNQMDLCANCHRLEHHSKKPLT
jgi:hypothetical protein